MSKIQQLLESLKNVTLEQSPTKKRIQLQRKKSIEEIKLELINDKQPWKCTSTSPRKQQYLRLKNKHLNEWDIYRIPLSPRSYSKNHKTLKIPSARRQFMDYRADDGEGHLPYLYQSDLPKIQRLRSIVNGGSFKPTRRSIYFGMEKIKSQSTNSIIIQKAKELVQ